MPEPDTEDLIKTPIGGGIKRFRAEADRHLSEFIMLRTPNSVHKVSLPHETVFKAVWKAWIAKRVAGEDDPGVRVSEIVEQCDLNEKRVRSVLKRLVHQGVVISTLAYRGYQGAKALYRPTEQGLMLFAMAETLGPGHMVTVGGTPTEWTRKSDAEPSSIFEHAALQARK